MGKILSLDLDGVLNTGLWHSIIDKDLLKDKYGYKFETTAVVNFEKIIAETGAEIVISSSWKCMGLPKLQKIL